MPLPRPAPGTLKWWVVGGVWVVAATALIVWVGLTRVPQQIQPQVTGFVVVDAGSVVVDYDVLRPANVVVRCVITALDIHHGQVGVVTDEVPASAGTGTAHRQVTVRTSAPAVTGLVDSCVRG